VFVAATRRRRQHWERDDVGNNPCGKIQNNDCSERDDERRQRQRWPEAPYARTSKRDKLNERPKTPASRAGLRSVRTALVRGAYGRVRRAWCLEPQGCQL